MTLKDIVPLCMLEILSPKLMFEKVVVLQRPQNSDEFLCLFIKRNYEKPEFYQDDEERKD